MPLSVDSAQFFVSLTPEQSKRLGLITPASHEGKTAVHWQTEWESQSFLSCDQTAAEMLCKLTCEEPSTARFPYQIFKISLDPDRRIKIKEIHTGKFNKDNIEDIAIVFTDGTTDVGTAVFFGIEQEQEDCRPHLERAIEVTLDQLKSMKKPSSLIKSL